MRYTVYHTHILCSCFQPRSAMRACSKGKDKAADKAQQAEEAKRKKLERDRLLAEEEASLPSKPAKAAPKAGAKKTTSAPVKSTPKIPDFGSSLSDGPDALSSFSASGIDDALDALSLATSRTDKAYVGSQASPHPGARYPFRLLISYL